jgi:hypothetical protein
MNAVLEGMKRLKHELGILQKAKIHIGIQGDEDSEVLIIATVHEFGATGTNKNGHRFNFPERSFIRASYENELGAISKFAQRQLDDVINGKKKAVQALNAIGAFCVMSIQGYIDEGKVQPPSDFENKNRFVTLYETGVHIRDRITYVIEGV